METPAPTPAPYDEMYTADGQVRPPYAVYSDWLIREPEDALRQKRAEADACSTGSASPSPSTARRTATSG